MAVTVCSGAQEPPDAATFLSKYLGLSRSEINRVELGLVVAKTLKSDKAEVASLAIARFHVPREFYIDSFRDIENHKKGEAIQRVKKFADQPCLEDLRDAELTARDLQDLKNCHVGKCNLKLPTQFIERFHNVNWSAEDSASQANLEMRELLVDYVRSYLADGNSAMVTYSDKSHPLPTQEEFKTLLEQQPPPLSEFAPAFYHYLRDFRTPSLPGIEDFVYWSMENYGHNLKPILSITHVTIDSSPLDPQAPFLIASKQIYASHYLETSLGLTVLIPDRQDPVHPGFYLVYLNRTRVDVLRKWYSGLAREKVSSAVRDFMRSSLIKTRTRIETVYHGD